MASNFLISGIMRFIDDASPVLKTIDGHMSALQKKGKTLSEGFAKMSPALKSVAIAGGAVGAGIGYAVKQAGDFEANLERLAATNQVTRKEIDNLGAAAITLSSQTKFATTDILAGTAALVQTGASATEAAAAMKPISQAAKVAGIDYAVMSKLISDATEGLGKNFNEIPKLTDQMAAAAKAGTITIDQLAAGLANTQAISQKMDFGQMTASLTSLIDAGIDGGSAAQMLSLSMNQLLTPSEQASRVWGGMTNTLAQFTDKSGKLRSMPEIIGNIEKALNSQGNAAQRNQLLIDLFGARGEKTFAILKKSIADTKFDKIVQGVAQSDGAMGAMAKNMKHTLNDTVKQFLHNLDNVLILLGSMSLPSTTEMVMRFGKALETGVLALQGLLGAGEKTPEMMAAMDSSIGQFFAGFIDGTKEVISQIESFTEGFLSMMKIFVPETKDGAKGIGELVAKGIALLAIVGPIAGGLFVMGTGFNTMFKAIHGAWMISTVLLSTMKAIGLFFLTNPFGIAITVIGALIGSLYLLAKNWDTVKAAGLRFFDAIGPFGTFIFRMLVTPLRLALTPMMELVRFLATTSLGMSALQKLGINPANVEDMTRTISMVPRWTPDKPPDLTAAASVDQAARVNAAAGVSAGAADMQAMLQPPSAGAPNINMSVQPPPVNMSVNIPLYMDNREVGRAVGKQMVENAERRGTILSSQQKSSTMNNGPMAVSSGAQ